MESGASHASDIAVIGMAGRFPGAENVEEFWENIAAGVESIRRVSEAELLAHGATADDIRQPHYVPAKGVLEDAAMFAASFFGYSPNQAKMMDPQQRVALEVSFAALEHAGLIPERYSGAIGTFVSAGFNTYLLHCLAARPELHEPQHHYQMAMHQGNDFLATRIAYKLNLTGPAQTVQTACSSSLVAIHNACQSLLAYECDAALAGGCVITAPVISGYLYKKDGIGSPDGHCRPFDKDAAGTVPGNGAGIVVLKRLEDAVNDRDHIYAVIKSSAINNDGNKKISFTAPSIQGQEAVVRTVHALAGVSPNTISYLEAHGTGTTLGDPIEIEALTRAFAQEGEKAPLPFCAIGSAKANIGHLDAAAGVAGFIKAVLMLQHRQLPPQINFDAANPRIPFATSPFYVNRTLTAWPESAHPRRAGVSAFGIGGTNAHVVLEESIKSRPPVHARQQEDWYVLPISAENAVTVTQLKTLLVRYLEKHPEIALADVAYSLQCRRMRFLERAYVIAKRENGVLHIAQGDFPQELPAEQKRWALRWLVGEEMDDHATSDGHMVPLPNTPLMRAHYWVERAGEASLPLKHSAPNAVTPVVTVPAAHNYASAIGDILRQSLEIQTISPDENFNALGVDSLMAIDVCLLIEQRLGLHVSTSDFHRYPTLRQLCDMLHSRAHDSLHLTALPELAVELQHGEPQAPILFCIHPAGGSVTVFDEIVAQLPDTYRLIGIRSAGWGGAVPSAMSIEAMAQHYLSVVQKIQPRGPYHLCGSSIGGTIAFEIARLLRQQHQEVGLVALLDSPAALTQQQARIVPKTAEEVRQYIRILSPAMGDDLDALARRDPEAEARLCQLWSLHAASMLNHQTEACAVPIVYFCAAEKNAFLPEDLVFPWIGLAKGGIEVHAVAGNHLTLHQGENAKCIAAVLHKKLDAYSADLVTPPSTKRLAG